MYFHAVVPKVLHHQPLYFGNYIICYIIIYNSILFVHKYVVSCALKRAGDKKFNLKFKFSILKCTRIAYFSSKGDSVCSFCCIGLSIEFLR